MRNSVRWSRRGPWAQNHDRVLHDNWFEKYQCLAVSDGSGIGIVAAQAAAITVGSLFRGVGRDSPTHPDGCVRLIDETDRHIATQWAVGEATGVLLVLDGMRMVGASVGDTRAWLVDDLGNPMELTEHQAAAPLIGSGACKAVGFGPLDVENKTLFVATAGLWAHTSPELALSHFSGQPPQSILQRLVASLDEEQLEDDVSIVIGQVDGSETAVLACSFPDRPLLRGS